MSAESGLRTFINGIRLKASRAAAYYLWFKVASGGSANQTITWPNALPGVTSNVQISSTGNITYAAPGGGGSVTSVDVSGISGFITSAGGPITSTGTISLALATQTANTVFAGPTTGSAAAPTFRSLVYADLSSLVGTGSGTIAAGNDGRFHTQGTDSGTTQTSFQIDSGNTGPRVKNASGIVELRNAADNAYVSLRVLDLIITGSATEINTETVTINDNIIVLNNNVTSGTPTEDGGIQVRRGASTSASLLWDETNDFWKAGLVGSEVAIARKYKASFTNASLSAGILTVTHNLGEQYPSFRIYDENGKWIDPDDATGTDANTLTVDLTSFAGFTGSFNITVVG